MNESLKCSIAVLFTGRSYLLSFNQPLNKKQATDFVTNKLGVTHAQLQHRHGEVMDHDYMYSTIWDLITTDTFTIEEGCLL